MPVEQNPSNALTQTIENLPPEMSVKLMDAVLGKAEPMIESVIRKFLPSAIDRALRKVGYTEEIAPLLEMASDRSLDTKEDILKKALRLYIFAMDARELGDRVVIINSDDEIVHEIVGIEPDTKSPSTQKVAS
ncbi:MAG: hypothetical protein LC745_08420 [Planctomycetia bacterium]|nr:hypothetical protein [Planctomycetia bacterium]